MKYAQQSRLPSLIVLKTNNVKAGKYKVRIFKYPDDLTFQLVIKNCHYGQSIEKCLAMTCSERFGIDQYQSLLERTVQTAFNSILNFDNYLQYNHSVGKVVKQVNLAFIDGWQYNPCAMAYRAYESMLLCASKHIVRHYPL